MPEPTEREWLEGLRSGDEEAHRRVLCEVCTTVNLRDNAVQHPVERVWVCLPCFKELRDAYENPSSPLPPDTTEEG